MKNGNVKSNNIFHKLKSIFVKSNPSVQLAEANSKSISIQPKVGGRVMMMRDYSDCPSYKKYYPPVGVCGTIKIHTGNDFSWLIQWDSDTKGDGVWFCLNSSVEVIE